MNAGDARTIDDYPEGDTDQLLGLCADVLRSFGSAAGGQHLAIVGGIVPALHVPQPPARMRPHTGTTDLDLHLSLALLDGETADYYDSIVEGLRSLGLRSDRRSSDGTEVQWRWVGQYREATLEVELLAPARRSPAGRRERHPPR